MAAASISTLAPGLRSNPSILDRMAHVEAILFAEPALVRFVQVSVHGTQETEDQAPMVRRIFQPVRGYSNGWIPRIDEFLRLGLRALPVDNSETALTACLVIERDVGCGRCHGELYRLLSGLR